MAAYEVKLLKIRIMWQFQLSSGIMILRNAILCQIVFISSIGIAYGQVAERNFFQNSRLGLGVNFSWIPSDDIYDTDLGRPLVSYSYEFASVRNRIVEVGAKYTIRGGKSFNDDVYMAVGYVDFPILANIGVSRSFWVGGGLQPSIMVFEKLRYRGTRIGADPAVYSRAPSSNDLSAVLSTSLKMSPRARLTVSGAYSLLTADRTISQLSFLSIEGKVSISIGKSMQEISEVVNTGFESDLELVALEQGVIVVVLSKKEKLMAYYREKGDIETANQIQVDAREKNAILMKAFNESFDFCPVMFIYSDMCSRAQQGDPNALIFDGSNKASTVNSLQGSPYVFFRPGSIYGNTNALNRTGYHFEDINGDRLEEPYPSLNTMRSVTEAELKKMIYRLNSRLKSRSQEIKASKYYQESQKGALSKPVEQSPSE